MPKAKNRLQWLALNPRGDLWAKDESKYGQRMLQKMGWKPGQGLGKNEQGIKEQIKATRNRERKGFGFAEKRYTVADESEYECILSSLSQKYPQKSEDCVTNVQNSKEKHRYTKFMTSKDVRLYSEKDLASIFPKIKKLDKSENDDGASHCEAIEICEESSNILNESKISMNDYFAQKLANRKANYNKASEINDQSNSKEVDCQNIVNENSLSKSKHRKNKHSLAKS